jgi:hypothetical protein
MSVLAGRVRVKLALSIYSTQSHPSSSGREQKFIFFLIFLFFYKVSKKNKAKKERQKRNSFFLLFVKCKETNIKSRPSFSC